MGSSVDVAAKFMRSNQEVVGMEGLRCEAYCGVVGDGGRWK